MAISISAELAPPHVVIFPFMAQGHTLPLLDIAKELARRGLKVTIITIPSNAPSFLINISKHPSISLSTIHFPKGFENTANLPSPQLFISFITAAKEMKQPFEAVLSEMFENGCAPICVISDFFLDWTLESCSLFNIPRIVSHGMGVLPTLILKTSNMHLSCIADSSYTEPLHLPGLKIPFILNKSDFVEWVQRGEKDDPFGHIILEADEADRNSFGVLVNSFQELEGDYVAALEDLHHNNFKAWCVGAHSII